LELSKEPALRSTGERLSGLLCEVHIVFDLEQRCLEWMPRAMSRDSSTSLEGGNLMIKFAVLGHPVPAGPRTNDATYARTATPRAGARPGSGIGARISSACVSRGIETNKRLRTRDMLGPGPLAKV
jgi:hypothetical protein